MQTILCILEQAGGYRPEFYLKIENPPFMDLVIEAMPEPGPLGFPAISVAHYGEQNGDLMRDPEMCFELSVAESPNLSPFYYRNDYAGVEQWSRFIRDGHYGLHTMLFREHQRFALLWDKNLKVQRFVEAFTEKSIRG
jgi:hypothetical protein